ncbi:MAG TPA: carotenoid oxygenase family protein [Rhodoferax sp.]|nr:carotenoid oxygenase family protein [Rhodoferax sp.]
MIETVSLRQVPPPNMAPIDFETEVVSLPLQGRLPDGLRGTLVRNGPNPRVPDPKEHWFVGDGMLHAFTIADGQVHYRNRWVRTERWQAADAAARNPAARLHNEPPESAPPAQNNGAANTNVIRHAGRVLALEEAHLPIAMDLATLATLGSTDFGGGLHDRFTAHPKTDPDTGELLFFGYGWPESLSSGMNFGTISKDGRVTRFERFEAPYPSMVHDFAVSAGHVLFPVMPLTASRARAEAGRPPFAWEPQYGTRVGIMPRHGSVADLAWWSGPACYVFHVMNAWDFDGSVFADVMRYDMPPLFPLPDGSRVSEAPPLARLVRWQFDLADPKRELRETLLEKIPGEFPRIDDRRAGLPYRHGWFAGHALGAGGEPRMYASVVHLDHATAQRDIYTFDAPDHVSEPVFVPRAPDAEEGDGWLLATVWRGATNCSDLVIFDARHVAAGPVCMASLPHRVPDGFHGNWFAADPAA